MTFALEAVSVEQKNALRQMMELYCYDFSEFVSWPISEDGLFANSVRFEERWANASIHKYLLRSGGDLAGFAFVRQSSELTGDPEVFDMSEFFVMRGHRRLGAGSWLARELFARYQGRWEIRVMSENSVALSFWTRLVGEWSGGRYGRIDWNTEKWRAPVFSFDSRIEARMGERTGVRPEQQAR